jgi:PAS domain S-box-containing protein
LRKSGIDIIGNVPWGTHICQFHRTKEDLMDILVPYFKAGLENNEFCMWVTSQPMDVEDAKEALRKVVPDIDVYLEKGQIEIVSYSRGYANEGVFDSDEVISNWATKLDQALANGFEGLRTVGDNSWLKEGGWENFVDYEKKVDFIIGNSNIIALCPYFLDTFSAADLIEVACCHQFALIKREEKWGRIDNFGRKNIAEGRRTEEVLRQSEQCIGLKSVLSPVGEKDSLELADIIDVKAIQSLMDDFYKLAHIPMSLDDLKGNVLVGIGWQDICTRFHRVHPETCKHCVESDTKLSAGVLPGEFKLYRCRNNMWDIATPIMVGGQHVGNIFSGQFFFEDEPLDYELFRSQARKYGFNEEEYIAALEKVPRLSRETVGTGMDFFMKLAHMLSQSSYSNIKLVQALAERNALVDALKESEKRERARSNELAVLLDAVPSAVWIAHDPQALQINGNRLSYEWLRIPEGANASKSAPEGERPETFRVFKDGVELLPADMPLHISAAGTELLDYEFDFVYLDGVVRHVLGNARPLRDNQGSPRGSVAAFIDITERKQEEHRICRYNHILEGINWIFSNVVQAKTEEELGNTCLSVALEVTGSQFGFINEMGADGLLHDIAKSELAWEQCLMYDRTGHRRPPSDFAVHGLYGSVINNERGFFTNNPLSHPDSIGLPYGHPPITSFLGVPLVQEGKTVGLIAVANHEGGYSCEQQEDLEAIAPAVTQALQRKRSEEALRLSNIYNRSLIEASLDPSVTIGRDGKIKDVNGATEQVIGYSRNDLIGTDFSDYFTEPEKAHTGYQQVFIDGIVRDYPLEIQHKDGQITPVLYNASVYRDENGEVIGVFAAARDITERKKAEEALKKVHENLEKLVKERTAQLEKAYNSLKESEKGLAEAQKMAHIGNWEWDIAADKTYWSEEMYRIFGRDPIKAAPSYNEYLCYIHPDDRDHYCNSIKNAVKGKSFGIDYRIVLANGEERIVHLKSEFVLNNKDTPVRIKGIAQDVTERKKAEKALANLETARKKEIHHRIKNNLQVISSLLDLQAEKFRDKKVLDAFRESQNRVVSMALIHEELYKGEGTDNLNFPAYLQKLAKNLFQTYSLRSKNLHLLMDLEINAFFNMDTAIPLGIIVNELVSNSLKHAFIEGEEGEIRIRLCREEKNNEMHRSFFSLTISDNGKGMPENIELKAIESLGLQLVNILVDQVDGKIELKREKGTEFRITFEVAERS